MTSLLIPDCKQEHLNRFSQELNGLSAAPSLDTISMQRHTIIPFCTKGLAMWKSLFVFNSNFTVAVPAISVWVTKCTISGAYGVSKTVNMDNT